jgi:2-enoate reductase
VGLAPSFNGMMRSAERADNLPSKRGILMVQKFQDIIADLVQGYGTWFEDETKFKDGLMTSNLAPYKHLFTPIQINRLQLKNRIIMGPIGNISMADETGRPSLKMIEYFTARAKGGVGLITSGLIPISHGIDPAVTELGEMSYFPRIDRSRSVLAGWRDLVDNIHAFGARFFIQLSPGVGRVGSPECLIKKWKMPVSASWNSNHYMPAIPCRPLTDHECWNIIKMAGQAAADAKALKIDGVYLHGHEGYLLEQMTNTAFNRRPLGAFRNWKRFGIEIVKQIRARVGPDYPLMYRIDLSLALRETYGARLDRVKALKKFNNERSVEETLAYMSDLVKAGIDMFDVDLGCYENFFLPHPPTFMPPGAFLPVAKIVKDHFLERNIVSRQGLAVPIAAVGKLGYPDLAERAIADGFCDMIMLARPLLADPEWPNKVYAGRVREICPCIGDHEGCFHELIIGGHIQCSVNPCAGFEEMPSHQSLPVLTPKRIAVVGAGPAGIMAATTAAKRGHTVTLFEKQKEAGGWVQPGSMMKAKFDLKNYLDYLHQLIRLGVDSGRLNVQYGMLATPEFLKNGGYDTVIISTGAIAPTPAIEGAHFGHVHQATAILAEPTLAEKSRKIVIIGGGSIGCETALYLATEQHKEVTVVEALPYLMKNVFSANRAFLIHYLERAGVKLLNCTRITQIKERQVSAMRNISPTVPDPYITWTPILPENIPNPLAKEIGLKEREITLEADLVLLAIGLKSNNTLYYECIDQRVAPEIYGIGDALAVGNIFEAVKSGYAVAGAI